MGKKSEQGNNKPRILVVDDEDDIRESIQEVVQSIGYDCWAAPSGKDALAFLEKTKVDIVIADVRMPGGMNGFELTEAIKKKYDSDVIIITGYGKEFQYEEAVEKGAIEFILKPMRYNELIVRLKRVLRERALVSQRLEMEEQLRQMSITDDLTQLYNMRHFYAQLQLEMDRALRYKSSLSLVLIDMDGFKQYNDTHGHLEGDRVLSVLGEVILGCLRKSDTAYRYGGDEFTVLLPETHAKAAKKVAERIRKKFRAMVDTKRPTDARIDVTLSVGIAEYVPGEEMQDFIKRADDTMYEAKRDGGDRSATAHSAGN